MAAVGNLKIATLWDGLRFKKTLTKSREGGPRDVGTLYDNLDVIAPIPTDAQIILIDDVCTGGGHLKAAAKRIVEGGGECIFSICIARTANDKTRPAQGVLTDSL
jgi:predicted amidophosphoribosyltransferase